MKLGKLTILFMLSMMIFIMDGLSQCPKGAYERIASREIPNEPAYWFDFNTSIATLQNGSILIKVDTLNLKVDSINPQLLNNQRYGIYSIDSSGYQNVFIKELLSNISYTIGCGNEAYFIELKNCYIRFYTMPNNKQQVAVFNFNTSKVAYYELPVGAPIGYNDTCVFMYSGAFKLNKQKYKSGTIIALNENGIQIIKPALRKSNFFNYNTVFYSNTYKVSSAFLYKVDKDCSTEDHFSIKISYNNYFVDSFEVIQQYYTKPFIQVKGDTLICNSGFDYYGSSTNGTYKKYYKTALLGEWNQSYWVDSFPVLKENYSNYYNTGELLLVSEKCYVNNTLGLKDIDGIVFTLNNVVIKPESTFYFLVLAFNIKTNEFLGYPTVEFTDKK